MISWHLTNYRGPQLPQNIIDNRRGGGGGGFIIITHCKGFFVQLESNSNSNSKFIKSPASASSDLIYIVQFITFRYGDSVLTKSDLVRHVQDLVKGLLRPNPVVVFSDQLKYNTIPEHNCWSSC